MICEPYDAWRKSFADWAARRPSQNQAVQEMSRRIRDLLGEEISPFTLRYHLRESGVVPADVSLRVANAVAIVMEQDTEEESWV